MSVIKLSVIDVGLSSTSCLHWRRTSQVDEHVQHLTRVDVKEGKRWHRGQSLRIDGSNLRVGFEWEN